VSRSSARLAGLAIERRRHHINGMDLFLSKVRHPQARNAFRVVIKDEDGEIEIEIGSIGVQTALDMVHGWRWAIDRLIPMQEFETEGHGRDLPDCQRQFKAAWTAFAADPARLTEFIRTKRAARR
jgi:hypothetical protein